MSSRLSSGKGENREQCHSHIACAPGACNEGGVRGAEGERRGLRRRAVGARRRERVVHGVVGGRARRGGRRPAERERGAR